MLAERVYWHPWTLRQLSARVGGGKVKGAAMAFLQHGNPPLPTAAQNELAHANHVDAAQLPSFFLFQHPPEAKAAVDVIKPPAFRLAWLIMSPYPNPIPGESQTKSTQQARSH